MIFTEREATLNSASSTTPTTPVSEIQNSLVKRMRSSENIDVYDHHFAVEIITQHHLGKIVTRRTPDITCYGCYILNEETGKIDTFPLPASQSWPPVEWGGSLYHHHQPARGHWRRHSHGIPRQRHGQGHGVHPVPSHRSLSPRRPPLVSHHRGHARIRCRAPQSRRRRVHAQI